MNVLRPYIVMLAIVSICSCGFIGAPERASDTQNLNAISDDIAALSMTRSQAMHANDPMARTVLPYHDQLPSE
jgi:hypothetical protein